MKPQGIPHTALQETENHLIKQLTAMALFVLTHFIKDILWVRDLRERGKSRRRANGIFHEKKKGNYIYLDASLDEDTASKVLVHECVHGFVQVGTEKLALETEEEFAYAAEDFLWERLSSDDKAIFRSFLPSRLHRIKKPPY